MGRKVEAIERDAEGHIVGVVRSGRGRRECVNGDGRPISPPSKVICRECQEEITRSLEAMIARLEERAEGKP